MSLSNKTIAGVLAASVAQDGTFVVSYPDNVAPESGVTNAGDFYLATGHTMIVGSSNVLSFPKDFGLSFGTTNITVTNKSGATLLAGSAFTLELKERGQELYASDGRTKMAGMKKAFLAQINLGAPDAANATNIRQVADGILPAAQANAAFTGALVSGGVAVLDVARAVQLVSANAGDTTQIVTVYGTDVYGVALRENIALNGTTIVNGNKAFKTISRITASAATAGAVSVGTNTKLGLPVFLPSAGQILKEMQDGASATAGTTVAGILTAGGSTAVTGDVRGTYVPNSAPDGAKVYELLVALPDYGYKGIPQFNG